MHIDPIPLQIADNIAWTTISIQTNASGEKNPNMFKVQENWKNTTSRIPNFNTD